MLISAGLVVIIFISMQILICCLIETCVRKLGKSIDIYGPAEYNFVTLALIFGKFLRIQRHN